MVDGNLLEKARLGRSAVNHLETLADNQLITEAELRRCIKRIRSGFDAVLGTPVDVPPPTTRGPFTVVRGGLQ